MQPALRSSLLAGGLLAVAGAFLLAGPSRAEDACPGHPGAIGTARTVGIDPKASPLLGTLQYKQTVPLQKGEVILTFDDGPLPPMTTRVLDTLRDNCVKATFFIVGSMAKANPATLKRIAADGHTIGTHSQTHPLIFPKLTQEAGLREIDQGFASTDGVLVPAGAHTVPFFRFPGLGRTKFYEAYLRERGIAVFSVDLVADDWMHLKPDEVLKRALDRLEARGSGILLLHDIQPSTATMLPTLLAELKARGFRIVHMVHEGKDAVASTAATEGQASPATPAEPATANPVAAWPRVLAPTQPAQGAAIQEPPAREAARPLAVPSPRSRPVDAPVEPAPAQAVPAAQAEEPLNIFDLPKLLGDLFPKPAQ